MNKKVLPNYPNVLFFRVLYNQYFVQYFYEKVKKIKCKKWICAICVPICMFWQKVFISQDVRVNKTSLLCFSLVCLPILVFICLEHTHCSVRGGGSWWPLFLGIKLLHPFLFLTYIFHLSKVRWTLRFHGEIFFKVIFSAI